MLEVSGGLEKTKTKMLLASAVALFVSLTKTLPNKVTAIGLDLEGNESILGWFILTISSYFLIRFVMLSTVELLQYYLPDLISTKTSKTTGDTIGLTADECFNNECEDDYEIGTVSGEIHEINKKNEVIRRTYKTLFIKFSNGITLLFELFGPMIFSITSIALLYRFLT